MKSEQLGPRIDQRHVGKFEEPKSLSTGVPAALARALIDIDSNISNVRKSTGRGAPCAFATDSSSSFIYKGLYI